MNVLVTGGAGYIGSHVVRLLRGRGHGVVVLDDLCQGHREAIQDVALVEGDIADRGSLERAWQEMPFDAVVHFAAHCLVGESMEQPAKYYRNNVTGSLCLLSNLRELGVRRLVFSSSAATYGEPRSLPITEDHPQVPTNPYGETKLAFERALDWHRRSGDVQSISLRYFNAAGASADGTLGEDHDPETHLIPRVLGVALGKDPAVPIHGHDYPTEDGTCVRDFIHVEDLAEAHLLALEALEAGEPGEAYNLGSEAGFSVRQVVEAARELTGEAIPVELGPRRPGDPPSLVASSGLIRERLGWRPRHADLGTILETAWAWHRLHPDGYSRSP